MVKIQAQGKAIECERGANLRQALMKDGISVYNDKAAILNCRGLGTCGTCAVEVEGEVSEPSWREKTRLSLPPHSPTSNRRLSCQTKVLGDIKVTKHDGFWGQDAGTVWTPQG
jgi:ferredoxin